MAPTALQANSQIQSLGKSLGRLSQIVIISICLLFTVGSIIFYRAAESFEHGVRDQQTQALTASVSSITTAIDLWVGNQKRFVQSLANTPEVRSLALQLIHETPTPASLANNDSLQQLRDFVEPKLDTANAMGIFVIGANNISFASMRDTNLGTENYLVRQHPHQIRQAWAGNTVAIPPVPSDVPLAADSNYLQNRSVFVAAPILDDAGHTAAILTVRFSASQTVDRIVAAANNDSYDTYAFDTDLRFVTEPKHHKEHIQQIPGATQDTKFFHTKVMVTPKGERQPYPTFLARSASNGTSGSHNAGYVGYTGRRVIGAWTWNNALQVGIAAEINESVALAAFGPVYRYIKILAVSVSFLSLAMIITCLTYASITRRHVSSMRTDALTRIASRGYFNQALDEQFHIFHRSKLPLSLILLDIDHFKAFNDTYGHTTGDECLKTVADCLQNVCERTTDVAARYGGEEFALILPMTDAAGAARVAWKIQNKLRERGIPHGMSPTSQHVSASIGVVTAYGDARIATPLELINETDRCLYQAKDQGRNRIITTVIGQDNNTQDPNDNTDPIPLRAAG